MALEEYLYFPVWLLIGLAVPFIVKLLNFLLSPPNTLSPYSKLTYECGEVPLGHAQVRYNFQFFTFAVVFVVFDVLTVVLLSFAFIFKQKVGTDLMIPILTVTIVFIGILVIGLVYWLQKKALLWA